ncbi:MAG: SAM-dependent chlorinase/fluorinase [Actinobacteria bacterium]|nr:SAM-dependent chlorinase/fluorinase [Actinomycetota bacterium]MCA1722452.1 SAM-dependent chlorinase/fluorinase [Actinomycetota bacterium]
MAGAQWLTFLSDYGLEDAFLGVCKGVIARTAPDVRVLDVLHLVQPQDVEQGAAVLASAIPYLPVPAVHLALVDPFRAAPVRGVAVRTADGSTFVAPDNGLTSQAWDVAGGAVTAHVLDNAALWHPTPARTFRGRDVFSPVAARLAAGLPLEEVGRAVSVDELERITVRAATVDDDHVHAEVVTVDHFGNLTLNLQRADLESAGVHLGDSVELRCGGKTLVVPFALTYGEVPRGRVAVCEDSFRTVTVAVNQGSAATALRARRGDPLVLARVQAEKPAGVRVSI